MQTRYQVQTNEETHIYIRTQDVRKKLAPINEFNTMISYAITYSLGPQLYIASSLGYLFQYYII